MKKQKKRATVAHGVIAVVRPSKAMRKRKNGPWTYWPNGSGGDFEWFTLTESGRTMGVALDEGVSQTLASELIRDFLREENETAKTCGHKPILWDVRELHVAMVLV